MKEVRIKILFYFYPTHPTTLLPYPEIGKNLEEAKNKLAVKGVPAPLYPLFLSIAPFPAILLFDRWSRIRGVIPNNKTTTRKLQLPL